MKIILFCFTWLATALSVVAQSWTNYYGGPAELDDEVRAIVLDSNGSVFVAGTSVGSAGDAIVKYSNAGQPLWTNFTESAYALATDNNGNLIVTGSSPDWDYVTMKYSSSGLPLWTNRYGGVPLGLDSAREVAVDANGNVIVAGDSQSVAGDFSSLELATIKYSSGGVPLWTNRYRGMWVEMCRDVAMDSNGNVILIGTSDTIKLSSTGQPLWTNAFHGAPGSFDGAPFAARTDASGNVIVVGSSLREVIINGGSDIIADVQAIKYSAAGTSLWTNVIQQSWGDGATALAVDASGNAFVIGPFSLAKLSTAGSLVWSKPYLGWLNLGSVAVDGAGNVFVGGDTTTSLTNNSRVTIKYSNAGVPIWTNQWPTAQFRVGAVAAVEVNGNYFWSGWASGGGNRDWRTIKYAAGIESPSLTFQRLGNNLVLSWSDSAFGLQSAPAISGTFTNVPGATSPYTNPISGGQQFFRLVQ